VSALIVATNLLERVLGEVYAKASRGFQHGGRMRKTKDSPSAVISVKSTLWAKPGSRHDATSGFKLVERSVLLV
jgi:hypothetical protein